jgi:hypothetical protein
MITKAFLVLIYIIKLSMLLSNQDLIHKKTTISTQKILLPAVYLK